MSDQVRTPPVLEFKPELYQLDGPSVPGVVYLQSFPSTLSSEWLRNSLSVYANLERIHLQPSGLLLLLI